MTLISSKREAITQIIQPGQFDVGLFSKLVMVLLGLGR
jgi:hypothetical protein